MDSRSFSTPAVPEPLLQLDGICKQFANQAAANHSISVLNNLSLTLFPGQSLAIVGASGIGKSTLLHILGTLDTPDQGRYHFLGEDVLTFGNERLARFRNHSIGFVFQFHHLLPEFNALENVLMPALIQGRDLDYARHLAESMLQRVGLQHRLSHPVNKLSGGEQQRVTLARALVLRPSLLLADEPTGNLDRHNSRKTHELLLELNRDIGMSVIVATHNQELAALMERCLTLEQGSLVDV